MRLSAFLIFIVFVTVHTTSFALEMKGPLTQGGWIVGQTEPAAQVKVGTEAVSVDAEGYFFYGFSRHHPSEVMVVATLVDGTEKKQGLLISPREYETQHVKGVPKKTVNPDPDQIAQSRKDKQAILAARKNLSALSAFRGTFVQPVEGRITGVYGSRRTFNGEERSWHKGTDFAAPTGTPIQTPAEGIVQLAQMTFFNGNLVILDHGQQMFTIYAHLDEIQVKEGQKVAVGDILGTVGNTGRSTGPHLHWGLYWRNTALDPILLVDK